MSGGGRLLRRPELDAPDRVPVLAAIGLGSNLGERRRILERAVDALRASPGLRVTAVSSLYETEPVGGPPQPRYLNAALIAETRSGPFELLALLQEIERREGRDRQREERHGPRTLDLDLLLHGTARIDVPGLELPHPRLEARQFVLEPLAEIAPELVIPGSGRTVREALARLMAAEDRRGAREAPAG